MKTSLNGAGLGAGGLGLEGFVDLAARHGFEGVDFGLGAAKKLADERGGAGAVRDLFAQKGVAPAVFGLEVEWRKKDENAFNDSLAMFKEKLPLAKEIGVTRCCTWLPPSVSADVAMSDWEDQTVRRFRVIARLLADFGVRLGLEWVGPKHLRVGEGAMGPNLWVHTLDGLQALIGQVGERNVGLLVDCYHCYATGIGEAEVAQLSDDQIVHVHVNDARPGVHPDDVRDNDRLLPGEGVIDLAGFVRGLRAAGYTGFVAAEVLAPQPLAPDPDAAAEKVRAALRNIGL